MAANTPAALWQLSRSSRDTEAASFECVPYAGCRATCSEIYRFIAQPLVLVLSSNFLSLYPYLSSCLSINRSFTLPSNQLCHATILAHSHPLQPAPPPLHSGFVGAQSAGIPLPPPSWGIESLRQPAPPLDPAARVARAAAAATTSAASSSAALVPRRKLDLRSFRTDKPLRTVWTEDGVRVNIFREVGAGARNQCGSVLARESVRESV